MHARAHARNVTLRNGCRSGADAWKDASSHRSARHRSADPFAKSPTRITPMTRIATKPPIVRFLFLFGGLLAAALALAALSPAAPEAGDAAADQPSATPR